MLRKPTVFVLGAGASQPFGFPTGAELYNEVVRELQQNRPLLSLLENELG